MKEYIITSDDVKAIEEEFGIKLSFEKDDELIRCEDCKHYAILEDGSNELICDHKDGCLTPKPDGFCNYAEPKRNTKL